MKKLLFTALAVFITSAYPMTRVFSAGDHDHDHGKGAEAVSATKETKATRHGEIVDLACYLGHGAKGAQHQECALTCLKGGQPMGLLEADGTVYLLMASHEDGKPYEQAKTWAALQVEVQGPYVEKAGIKAITVETIKKL